jgi:MerR family transcriptional regulator, light-induced transcriptional regulator
MNGNGASSSPRHPIGVVAFRTGLSRSLLRAWERRYGAVTPGRSDGGRRLYSDADLAKLRLLRGAVDAGRSIGDVAHLSVPELEALVREDRGFRLADGQPPARGNPSEEAGPKPTAGASRGGGPGLEDVLDAGAYGPRVWAGLESVRALDDSALEHLLEREAASLDPTGLVDEFLVPLLEGIGTLWKEGSLSPAGERLASGVIASFLNRLIRTLQGPPTSPLILVATPSGTRHEIGALLAGAAAAGEGWRVTPLGPDLPAEHIAGAAIQREATTVALSVIHLPPGSKAIEEILELRKLLPGTVDLVVGGAGIRTATADSLGGRISLLPDLGALRAYCESRLRPAPRGDRDPDAPR